ncbi:hypothetical protein QN239_19265 [Mycolicibacterium sp. Y3]
MFRWFSRADFLAFEWFGDPPVHACIYCGHGPAFRLVHLNGDNRDCSRANLQYEPDLIGLAHHETEHAETMIRQVPPRRRPLSTDRDIDGRWKPRPADYVIEAPPSISFAGSDGPCHHVPKCSTDWCFLSERGNPFKRRHEATIPEQSRASRFLSMPLDNEYFVRGEQ